MIILILKKLIVLSKAHGLACKEMMKVKNLNLSTIIPIKRFYFLKTV